MKTSLFLFIGQQVRCKNNRINSRGRLHVITYLQIMFSDLESFIFLHLLTSSLSYYLKTSVSVPAAACVKITEPNLLFQQMLLLHSSYVCNGLLFHDTSFQLSPLLVHQHMINAQTLSIRLNAKYCNILTKKYEVSLL